jgi:hypothetical protein
MPKINIISLIVLLTLGVCGVANAQWTYVTAPYGRQLNDVVMLGSNSVVVAGGNEFNDPLQSVFITSDGGAEWMITQDIWGDWIQGLVFLNSQLGYAVGYNGALIKTLDGGTTWSVLPTAIGNSFEAFQWRSLHQCQHWLRSRRFSDRTDRNRPSLGPRMAVQIGKCSAMLTAHGCAMCTS